MTSTPSKPDLVALAPCPFCGGAMEEVNDEDGHYWVHPGRKGMERADCWLCDAWVSDEQTGEGSIGEWNTRHLASQPSSYETRDQKRWLWRVFGQGFPRGHEDCSNSWGDFRIIDDDDAKRLAAGDEHDVYEFVPYRVVNPVAPGPSEATPSTAVSVREALEFYADPFKWKKVHDPDDVVRVPDFYAETCFGDTATEALAALSPPVEAPVAVKPLEWVVYNPYHHEAKEFEVWHQILSVDGEWVHFFNGQIPGQKYRTIDAAKAAAQADYEQRILSAIDTGGRK